MSFLFDQMKQTAAQLDTLAKSSDAPDPDLARETLRQANESLSQMLGPKPNTPGVEKTVLAYYRFQRMACGLTEEQISEEVAQAFVAARSKHRDFDEYKTGLAWVAAFVVPDLRGIVGALDIDQYLEILYAAAKHADFLGFRDSPVQ
jgi:hypothetical protein